MKDLPSAKVTGSKGEPLANTHLLSFREKEYIHVEISVSLRIPITVEKVEEVSQQVRGKIMKKEARK